MKMMSTRVADETESLRTRRQDKRNRLYREERGIQLCRAAIVGIVAGLLGVLYQVSVSKVSDLSVASALRFKHLSPLAQVDFILVCGGVAMLASILIGKYAPESGGSGIPHIKAALLHLRQVRAIPLLIAKYTGGLAALAVGMSLGREGPTVQMGASAGKLVGDLMRAPRRSRDSLLAAGAGAGLAAAFNAPLAGFLFVMEELKREMSALTYGTALIATVCAVAITRYTMGSQPSFKLTSPGEAPLSVLPQVAVLGLVAGLGGVLFNKALVFALEIRSRHKVHRATYGFIVGAFSGAALLYCPSITGGGHHLAESILSGNLHSPDIFLACGLIFFGKLLLTCGSYGTGLPGGIFAPILVLGAVLGYAYGILVHMIVPSTAFSAEGFATLGMAALLSSSVRAPLTGVVLIVEMTSEYSLLYALLVGSFIAGLVADGLKDLPIYEALMERDLRLSGADVHPDEEPILVELLIEPHSAMDGKRVKDLRLPVGAILVTLERGARHVVPGGSTILRAGDMVTVMIEADKPDISLVVHTAAKAP